MSSGENCQICNENKFKYTCPRCNIPYCSLDCYKSKDHLKCSEAFYKQCIQDELAAKAGSGPNSKEEMRKIYDILRRIRESDAGIETDDFGKDFLDSDDEQEGDEDDNDEGEDGFSESDQNIEGNDELDIAERLKGVDINDADEVWEHLTEEEKDEFKQMVATGNIMKIMPTYEPWWLKDKQTSKIIELPAKTTESQSIVPVVSQNIPIFSNICSKEPSSCIHYNLWNIIAAYACTLRYFHGEHLTSSSESTAFLVNLCSTLKYGTNFEDVDDAIISVEMEALTTGNGTCELMQNGAPTSLIVQSREQLVMDSRKLMSLHQYKLAALSDILNLFQLSKSILKKSKKEDTAFQKLFALSSGMEELTKSKNQQLIKKIEFYLSFVNREAEQN